MPNSTDKISKTFYKICGLVAYFCGQVQDKSLASAGITRRLSIRPPVYPQLAVGNTWVQALMFTLVTHSRVPYFFRQLTDILPYLYTSSTPPITTTTKYINK
jgi:hypothetical protein